MYIGKQFMATFFEDFSKLKTERIESLAAEAMSAVASGYQFEPL